MTLLQGSDAFRDWAHIPSSLVFEGADRREPLLSICIPTFRRGDLLVESVKSALEQDWDDAFEIVIVDNDPASSGPGALLDALPMLERANFRYYVNTENIGMFGNWNRSIELGRGAWHTMLHDDDLLAPDFAFKMMGILSTGSGIDGLICRKRTFGLQSSEPTGAARKFARTAWLALRFRGRSVRRYRPDRFFWSASNPVGLIARKLDLMALGGYQPAEYPTSDHYLELRYALRYRLYEARYLLADVRMLANESIRPDVVLQMIVGFHHLREKMAGTVVPRWWMRFSPLIIERYRQAVNMGDHGAGITKAQLEASVGLTLPSDHRLLLMAIRGALRGY